MMFLLFHVICSCIFHAYVPFFSFVFILLLIGTLLRVSLSLSLSLFLSDSLRRAPKRKTTPSQNPLCPRASSSSDSTPLHVRFRDDKARQDFLKNFSRHGIHSEHQVAMNSSVVKSANSLTLNL